MAEPGSILQRAGSEEPGVENWATEQLTDATALTTDETAADASLSSAESVVIGHEIDTDASVHLDETKPHLTVLGQTQAGKSTLLEHLILNDLEQKRAVVVLDPHQSLIPRVIALAKDIGHERIVLLEPWADRPFRMNPLERLQPPEGSPTEVADYGSLADAFARLFNELTYMPQLEGDLNLMAQTVGPRGGGLGDAWKLLMEPAERERFLTGHPDEAFLRDTWAFNDRLIRGDQGNQSVALFNRLRTLLLMPTMRAMVGSRETTVPFDNVLYPPDEGPQAILLNLPPADERLTNRIGSVFLGLLLRRIFTRGPVAPDDLRHHLWLYIDEFERFSTPAIRSLMLQGAKFGVHLRVAHQRDPDPETHSAEAQAGAFVIFSLGGDTAQKAVPDHLLIQPSLPTIKKGISHDPLGTLRRGLHANERVRELFSEHLLPVLEEIEELGDEQDLDTSYDEDVEGVDRGRGTSAIDTSRRIRRRRQPDPFREKRLLLRRLANRTTRLLIDVMEGKQKLHSNSYAERIHELVTIRHSARRGSMDTGPNTYLSVRIATELAADDPFKTVSWSAGEFTGTGIQYLTLLEGRQFELSLKILRAVSPSHERVRKIEQNIHKERRTREQARLTADAVKFRERYDRDGSYSVPKWRIPRWYYAELRDFPKDFDTVASYWHGDHRAGQVLYSEGLSPLANCRLLESEWATKARERVQESIREDAAYAERSLRGSADHEYYSLRATRQQAFLDAFGEGSFAMALAYAAANTLSDHERFDGWGGPFADTMSTDGMGTSWYRSISVSYPQITGLPLVKLLMRQSILIYFIRLIRFLETECRCNTYEGWCPRHGARYSWHPEYRDDPPPAGNGPHSKLEPDAKTHRIYLPYPPKIADQVRRLDLPDSLARVIRAELRVYYGLDNCGLDEDEFLVTGRILMQKAELAIYYPELAELVCPNEIVLPKNPALAATITNELRLSLTGALIDRKAKKPPLTETQLRFAIPLWPSLSDSEVAHARQLLVQELTGEKGEERAELRYAEDMTFARAISELCELLQREPLEVVIRTGEERPPSLAEGQRDMVEDIKKLHRQAYYRAGPRQYKILTLPRLKVEDTGERFVAIQESSRHDYGKPLAIPLPRGESPPPVSASAPKGRRSRATQRE